MSTVLMFCLLKWDFVSEMVLLSAHLNTSVESPASAEGSFLNNLHTIKDNSFYFLKYNLFPFVLENLKNSVIMH